MTWKYNGLHRKINGNHFFKSYNQHLHGQGGSRRALKTKSSRAFSWSSTTEIDETEDDWVVFFFFSSRVILIIIFY